MEHSESHSYQMEVKIQEHVYTNFLIFTSSHVQSRLCLLYPTYPSIPALGKQGRVLGYVH